MLRHLKRALDDKGITLKAYAAILGVSEKTAWNKVNGDSDFTWSEVRTTKKDVFPEYDTEYLFSPETEKEQSRTI